VPARQDLRNALPMAEISIWHLKGYPLITYAIRIS